MTDPYLSAISNAADELDKTLDAWASPEQIEQDIADGKRCSAHSAMMPCLLCRSAVMLRELEFTGLDPIELSDFCAICYNDQRDGHTDDCKLNQLLSDLGD